MTRRIWITETEKQKSIRKITKKQKSYKPIGLTGKKEIFTPKQAYCPECGYNTYPPQTMNRDTGTYQAHYHYRSGDGSLRCDWCNNKVLYR